MSAESESRLRIFCNDAEAHRISSSRGFQPMPVGDDQVDIVSNDGEAIVHMKDGVDYVLRFGEHGRHRQRIR